MNLKTYPNFFVRALASVLSTGIVLMLMAGIFGNAVQSRFLSTVISEDTPFVFLISGIVLMGLAIAYLYPYFQIDVDQNWLGNALRVAVPLGLTIFFLTHMIQVGYTTLSPTGWLLEGLYDSFAPIISIVVLTWLTHRRNKA